MNCRVYQMLVRFELAAMTTPNLGQQNCCCRCCCYCYNYYAYYKSMALFYWITF